MGTLVVLLDMLLPICDTIYVFYILKCDIYNVALSRASKTICLSFCAEFGLLS